VGGRIILSRICLTIDEVWIGELDLLITCTYHSKLQVITGPLVISTVHKTPQHPLSLFQPAVSSPAVPSQRLLPMEILQLPALRFSCHIRPCRALVNSTIAPSLLSLPCRARLKCHPSTEITHASTNYVTSLHSTELPTIS
jgi:hypothetical protein